MRFVAEGIESLGHLANASRAGVFVLASELPRTGAAVAVQFRSPTGTLVDLRAEVRWTTQGITGSSAVAGFGVQLHEPSPEYREFMLWALAQVKDPE